MRSSHLILVAMVAATVAAMVPWRTTAPGSLVLEFATWGMPFEDRLFRDTYARGFEALNPGVSVVYNRYEQNLTDKYLAWHVVGKGADVMRVRITDYHTFVQRGMLAKLDDFMSDPEIGLTAEERADFIPAIWDLLDIDGSWYALPTDNAQYGLYYNKSLFDRYNGLHPDDPIEYPNSEWTWSDLRDAVDKLTLRDGRGEIVQYGIDFDLWAWPYMALFRQAGGELWDEAQTTTLINSREGVEALSLIVELIGHTASMRAVSTVGSMSGPDKLFAGGQTAMLLDGSWRAPDLERVNRDLDFAIAPLPHFRRRAVVTGSVLWAISAHSQNKQLAWQMIRWMSTGPRALQYWDMLRVAPPPLISIIRSDAFRQTRGLMNDAGGFEVFPMTRESFADRGAWLQYAITPDPTTGEVPGFVPVAPYQKDLEDNIEAMLKRAVTPGRSTSLKRVLDDTAQAVHRIIDRDRASRGLAAVDRRN